MGRRNELAIAYHEAGHVIAALHLGVAYRSVTIVPNDYSEGHVAWARGSYTYTDWRGGEPSPRVWRTIENQIILSLAGGHAQRAFNPRSVRLHHGHDDRRLAEEGLWLLVEAVGSDEYVAHFRLLDERAKRIVRVHWSQVDAVANALVQRKTLTPEEVYEATCY